MDYKICLFATIFVGLAAESRGAILSDNLGEVSGGTAVASVTTWEATQFTTDAFTYNLDSVTLKLQQSSGTAAPSVQIWTGNSSIPTTFLGSLSNPGSISSTLTDTQFTASGITLNANSTYWVVLTSSQAGSNFRWSFSNTDNGTGSGFSTHWAEGNNPGGTGQGSDVTWSGGFAPYVSNPYQASVSATAVPEPATASAAVAGICGICFFFFRKGRR